jgi:uncharacterized membrane protein
VRTTTKHTLAVLAVLLLGCLSGARMLPAQTYNPFNERDDQYRLLGLKRAKQAYDVARAEFERQQELYEKELITRTEFERARNIFTDAEVNYQQSLLAVLFEEQFVTVSSAVKYQASDGSKHVRITVANTSGGSAEFLKLVDVDDELFRALQPEVIANVYVSVLNDGNAIIGRPYEAKIERLQYGDPVELDFELLQDLDAVTVFIIYANGSQRSMKIFLEKDATVDRVLVQSEQFSQEVELGTTASFDLSLELFSGTSNTFSLAVANLPEQIGRYFEDPGSQARLSQLKFTETTQAKRAVLNITLPDRPSDEVLMDKAIPFFVLVMPRDVKNDLPDLTERQWTEQEIAALDVGYVKLELVPRGIGELLVRLPQLFHSIDADESADVIMDILNEGTHRLDNIEVRVDLPLNWSKTIEPNRIQTLDIGNDARVRLSFTPPPDVAPGKYDIRVRTSAMSNNQPVISEDKTVTVEILGRTNVVATVSIVLALVLLIGGIVAYGVKLSRR